MTVISCPEIPDPEFGDPPEDNEAENAGRLPIREPTSFKPVELPRRFYVAASVVPAAGGWEVRLDGKPARTPGKSRWRCQRRRLPTRWPRNGPRKGAH